MSLATLDGLLSNHLLAFVPSHEFFMVLPRVSRVNYRRLVSNIPGGLSDPQNDCTTRDTLHQHQCKVRFSMTEKQWELFSAISWPLLHLSFREYSECQAGARMSAATATSEPASFKRWAVECSHLYHHLYYAELYLFRHAPATTRCGVQLMYHLPSLLQALLIDQLTSFFVYHPFCGYQGLQYLRRQTLLFVDYGYFATLTAKASAAGRQTQTNAIQGQQVHHELPGDCRSVTRDTLDEETQAELSQSLIEWWLTTPHTNKVDAHGHVRLFEDEMVTIAYSYEKDESQRSFRRRASKSEVRLSYLVHMLWFGPELHRLELALLQTPFQSSHPNENPCVDVYLNEAVIVPMALELGKFDFCPVFIHTSAFISQGGLGGSLYLGDAYRIEKWLAPRVALQCSLHVNHNEWTTLRRLAAQVDEADERKRNSTLRMHPPLMLAFERELHSVWWEKAQREWKQVQEVQWKLSCAFGKNNTSVPARQTEDELAISHQFSAFLHRLTARLLQLKTAYTRHD